MRQASWRKGFEILKKEALESVSKKSFGQKMRVRKALKEVEAAASHRKVN
jgi:hypothetical protein